MNFNEISLTFIACFIRMIFQCTCINVYTAFQQSCIIYGYQLAFSFFQCL